MAYTKAELELEQRYGRGEPQKMRIGDRTVHELPVFDRAHSAGSADPALHLGLGVAVAGGEMSLPFKRNDNDRRPGRPVPLGEPDPDRFAKAEAIRLAIEAREARHRIAGSEGRADTPRHHYGDPRASRRKDILSRWGRYVEPKPEEVVIEARRDDRVLRFRSMNEALRIMTGEKLVATSFDINADLYGWKWTRIRDGRTNKGGRNRKS